MDQYLKLINNFEVIIQEKKKEIEAGKNSKDALGEIVLEARQLAYSGGLGMRFRFLNLVDDINNAAETQVYCEEVGSLRECIGEDDYEILVDGVLDLDSNNNEDRNGDIGELVYNYLDDRGRLPHRGEQ